MSGARRRWVGAVGAGLRPAPTCNRWRMSRRQGERASRFQVEIEAGVRSAAVAFRDNHVEASVSTAVRLWWTSHLRGQRFAQLVRQAYDVTQARISVGGVERGEAGRREAMAYFLTVLRDLVTNAARHAEVRRSQRVARSADPRRRCRLIDGVGNLNGWHLRAHSMRSATATGWSQCGHDPPGPTRRQN